MGDGADAQPGLPARRSLHLQPVRGADLDGEELPDDEYLDRLLADVELLMNLQLSQYSPEAWRPVAEQFARYGFDVLRGWLYNGLIFAKVHEKTGRHLQRPEQPFDVDAIADLASKTVIVSLEAFLEKVLKRNMWDPEKGATLKSFFIGQCCLQFSNVLRSWFREQKRLGKERPLADPSDMDRLVGETAAADRPMIEHVEAVLALNDLSTDRARKAVALRALGYSHAEIADELGLADEKSVENLIGYQRRRLGNTNFERGRGVG